MEGRVLGSERHEFTGVCGRSYLHVCAYIDTVPSLFAFFLSGVTSLFKLSCHNTVNADVKRSAGSDECSVRCSYSAIVFMNFWLFFSLLGNLVCNPTGYKLQVVFNLPERTGAQ